MRKGSVLTGGAMAIGVAAALVWALRPDPVIVDLATVRTAPMEVTVAAEGITRISDPWLVTAPITGTTTRSPVQVGDIVVPGETEVAVIQPAAPAFLDARARLQAEAAVTEAQAAVSLAEVEVTRAETDLDYAQAQLSRNRALAARGIIPQRALEDTLQSVTTAEAALSGANFALDLRRATLSRMQAQLFGPTVATETAPEACCVRILAPHEGTVLEVIDRSARLVQAGSPLLTIGSLEDLAIEVDLLSSDAVRVPLGAAAHVERWGGPEVIAAHVTRIDPAGFTRVSALGIEEQRVRLHLAIDTPAMGRQGLGDRFRVFVRVVVWSQPAVLQVPQSALFRDDGGWAVFRVQDNHAVLTPVTIGQSQSETAQILSGLTEGDRIITYPGNRITEGIKVSERGLP
ncbi:MAG: HlyD family efflux transporter periplasmic adaptor subunit [Paracoccaceae bacterium]|nr:HlyD family efflux transporter periplasmic adaptor subunit [Paracoccaceae bacterium]